MKKIKNISLLMLLCTTILVGCNDQPTDLSNDNTSKESPISSVEEQPSSSVEKTKLVKGTDYIAHNETYQNGGYDYNEDMWYINNLKDLPLPDPQVYEENGIYYITGTSDRTSCKEIDIYWTLDFITYNLVTNVYIPSSTAWERTNPEFYAPEIYCFNGVYYLYYSAMCRTNDNGLHDYRRYNSVVSSTNPLGPYKAIVNDEVDGDTMPLFVNDADDCTSLDATIFKDDDGQMYMYYAITDDAENICGVKMTSPYQADWSTRKVLVRPGFIDSNFEKDERLLEWEMWRGYYIAEGPYMIKSPNGKYYLTYSVNGCWNKYYSVCYAISDDPLGNFVKPYEDGEMWTNLLLGYSGEREKDGTIYEEWSGFASGTGHHCFFKIGDQLMIGYHAHQNRDYNSDSQYTARYFAMDYIYFDEDGNLFANGPSYSLQPLPEELSEYKNIAFGAEVKGENVSNIEAINDHYIVSNYNIAGEDTKEVSLGKYEASITIEFDKEYEIGGFAVYSSAFYDYQLENIKEVIFDNGYVVENLSNCYAHSNPDGLSFVFPNSGITLEFLKTFSAKSVTFVFNSASDVRLNEIVVLGK